MQIKSELQIIWLNCIHIHRDKYIFDNLYEKYFNKEMI
jgi:hypothetical protein